MQIEINSKKYDYNKLYLVDSISRFEWEKYNFFIEKLYISEFGEYILETRYQLNRAYPENDIETDFEEKVEYRVVSFEEADAWLDDAIWQP